ncbi:hypothetical protein KVU_1731 [Ketogulonicigenium vulgare WSH-001]|uniref:Uncharacterized protein n=1 Tax=Ketogulonicigenium vulgare (strain WSH-001) TaxID=759362 RepID=F9Y3F0_KETVW|nr:hypothetical protein KVU_1731 [Ketogulonicigenium vulgare WSH-001]
MIHRTQASSRHAQRERTAQHIRLQRDILQIRQETTLGLVVCVAYIVAHHRAFSGQFATARHGISPSYQGHTTLDATRLAQRFITIAGP